MSDSSKGEDEMKAPEVVVLPIFAARTKDPAARRSRPSPEILRTSSSTKKKKHTCRTILQSYAHGEYHHIPRDLDRRDADKCGFCALNPIAAYPGYRQARLVCCQKNEMTETSSHQSLVTLSHPIPWDDHYSSRHHLWRNLITSPQPPNSSSINRVRRQSAAKASVSTALPAAVPPSP
jgi:hypothetical protein